jgi:hypothetical protein
MSGRPEIFMYPTENANVNNHSLKVHDRVEHTMPTTHLPRILSAISSVLRSPGLETSHHDMILFQGAVVAFFLAALHVFVRLSEDVPDKYGSVCLGYQRQKSVMLRLEINDRHRVDRDFVGVRFAERAEALLTDNRVAGGGSKSLGELYGRLADDEEAAVEH